MAISDRLWPLLLAWIVAFVAILPVDIMMMAVTQLRLYDIVLVAVAAAAAEPQNERMEHGWLGHD